MKKMFSLALALIMALALCVPAMAAQIEVTNAEPNQTYTAYKVFDLTKAADAVAGDNGHGYAYKIDSSTNKWWPVIVKDVEPVEGDYTAHGLIFEATTTANVYNVKVTADFNPANFAAFLNNNKAGKDVAATATGATVEGEKTLLNIDAGTGYYFVDSSMGALCALLTENAVQPLVEKNDHPEIEKTVADEDVVAAIGDTVNYTITVTVGGKADTNYVVHDEMSESLTLNPDSFEIKIGETAVASDNYVITTTGLSDDCTFEIEFKDNYTATLEADTVITITYNATLNEKAVKTDVATNKASLKYGNSSTVEKETKTYSFDFDLLKYTQAAGSTEKTQLEGAEFVLSTTESIDDAIKFVAVEGGYRKAVTADETGADTKLVAGKINIDGLDDVDTTYYLIETKAPDGYNKLTDPVVIKLTHTADGAFTIAQDDTASVAQVEVLNQTGTELPSTGGIGTTIFYTVGGLLMAAAVVLFITKKKLVVEE